MPSNIYGKFADQNSEVVSGQVSTSNNNQKTLNAAIAESNHLRATTAALQPSGLVISPGNLVPNVTGVVQNTIGAALGGIGQAGTPSEDPGGGGIPCFVANTWITVPSGEIPINEIQVRDVVLAFDNSGKRVPRKVTDKFEHLVQCYTNITFSDGRVTGLIEDHRYWTHGDFAPIRDIDSVWHWNGHWEQVFITGRESVQEEIIVYNFTVEGLHTYIANGDAVSNLKPQP